MIWKKTVLVLTFIIVLVLIASSMDSSIQSSSPTGLAPCPGCKQVTQPQLPDHSMLLVALVLAIAIFGSHSLSHCCKDSRSKKALIVLFFGGFIALSAIFGVSFVAPTAAIAVTAKKSASIFAALGVVVLIMIFVKEMLFSSKLENAELWKNIEKQEDTWIRKK